VRKNPRNQWIAIPIPDAGIPPKVVDAARETIRGNRQPSSTGRRFFELSGGIVHCGGCGRKMFSYTSVGKGRIYSYYRCSEVVRNGKNACAGGQFRINHRAEELEQRVWQFVSTLMNDPEQLRSDLERMLELERQGLRGDPDRETRLWLEKLAEADRIRSGYQDLAAKGLMTYEELGEKLGQIEKTRETAERELEALQSRRERVEQLERDKDTLLKSYATMAPAALDGLCAEERHRLYKILRLKVTLNPDQSLGLSGALGSEFIQTDPVPRCYIRSMCARDYKGRNAEPRL